MSKNSLDGMVYNRETHQYEPEFPETEEEVERFVVTEPRREVDVSELPTSPKSIYRAAVAAGWEAHAWLTVGVVPPTLYLHDSAQSFDDTPEDERDIAPHKAGDVKFDGYEQGIYVVEAREPKIDLGFRAFYLSRSYGEGDKRNKAGGFDCAWVADPVGVVQELYFDYQPIKITVGRDDKGRIVETESSFQARKDSAILMARYLHETCNDGSFILDTRPLFTQSTKLTAWLKEWASYGRLTNG